GLGYETLAAIQPRLVYCSIAAFGRTGPRAESGGYEAVMQAFSGVMSITGEVGGAPVRCGVSFLDLGTGAISAFGIVNALLQRETTGRGQRVDASLLATAVSLLNYHAEGVLVADVVPKALGSSHPSIVPYRNFRCRDGRWIFIAGANDRLWQRLAAALRLEHLLADPRFASNQERVKHRAELEAELEAAIARHDAEPLLATLAEADVPAVPVNTVDRVLADAQTAALGMIERVRHPTLGDVPMVGFPVKFSNMTPSVRAPAPRLGEHTDAVLAEHGYTAAEIAELRARRVVA
ncbi:MAG TPA: CaiB/BaiF CoA-transferase family protein, partial [Candidatus Binatia bacterium]|nr:CaiB/BaiF CoA-transferase family protein [Candidatus Binatia bacterium]